MERVPASLAAISLVTIAPLLLGGPCLIAVLANQAVIERLDIYHVGEREALLTARQGK